MRLSYASAPPIDLRRPAIALYLHVPFCRARCAYCDFDTFAGLEAFIPAYADALAREIRAAGERWRPATVPTIYFGGGTPSLLPLQVVDGLVDALHTAFDLSQGVEVSFEANPGTVSPDYLCGLRQLGINRLSLGIQSADDGELERLGRVHSWRDAVLAVDWSRKAGFDNLSLDLLFGVPAQSLSDWEVTLGRVMGLDSEHLSLYGLVIEKGTPLAERIRRGDAVPVEDDLAADMIELAEEMLADAGYFHYEISNWARTGISPLEGDARWWPEGTAKALGSVLCERITGRVCHHNLTYWRNRPWLGLGAAAHSWMPPGLPPRIVNSGTASIGGQRWANPRHPQDYVASMSKTVGLPSVEEVEVIDPQLEMGETMMLGLRLAEGVRARRFEQRFGRSLVDVFGGELDELRGLDLVTWDGVVARLTARGRLLGNRVFERFI